MRNRWAFTMLFVLVIVPVFSLASGEARVDDRWSAWLFNDGTQIGSPPQLLRVYLDGTVEKHVFSLPTGTTLHGPLFAFSGNGNRIAFCTVSNGVISVIVDDLYEGAGPITQAGDITFLERYEVGASIACPLSEDAFNVDDDSRLALSVLNYIPDTEDPSRPSPLWELVILNLATGDVERRLTADTHTMAEFAPFTLGQGNFLLPMVRHFGSDVVFTLVPYDPTYTGMLDLESYVWEPETGTVRPYPQSWYSNMTPDFLQIGGDLGQTLETEVAWADSDDTLPGGPMSGWYGSFSPFNVLMYRPKAGEPYAILHDENGFSCPAFIDNGRRIAVRVYPSFCPCVHREIALDRNGQVLQLPISSDSGCAVCAPDGYAFLDVDLPMMTARFIYHRFAADGYTIEPIVLWQTSDYRGWVLVWNPAVQAASNLEPFPAATLPQDTP
jgi:hypothetical protein